MLSGHIARLLPGRPGIIALALVYLELLLSMQYTQSNAMVTASGRVADAGTINVTLSSGMKRAVGYGRLTATSGSGTWRGGLCSGTWTAQRI